MKHRIVTFGLLTLLAASTQPLYAQTKNPPLSPENQRIEQLTGAKGTLNEIEGAFKVSLPRPDLDEHVSGVKVTPEMGTTAWASFMTSGGTSHVMGDMVLTEEQVNPVLDIALANGLEVTGIHNHFFWDTPRIMYMHIHGMGTTDQTATAVGKMFSKIKEKSTEKGYKANVKIDPTKSTLDPRKIEAVIGQKGEMKNGVYKVTIGRTTHFNGLEIGNTMGVNTWAAFAGSDNEAVVDGDFAMLESEVQSVMKALRGAGINIVALHNHMMGESPRIMFLHFWGTGSTADLAKGVKAALDVQKK
jgi:hypothetical protein